MSNVSRAVPTLALLTLFAVSPIGFGNRATTIALALFAIPPILANTYVGVRGVDADIREAARGVGMSRGQVIRRVDLPLAMPLIMTGVRTAAVQVVATASLAALVGGGGLGRMVRLGFGQQNYGLIIAGALLIAAAGGAHRAGPGAADVGGDPRSEALPVDPRPAGRRRRGPGADGGGHAALTDAAPHESVTNAPSIALRAIGGVR